MVFQSKEVIVRNLFLFIVYGAFIYLFWPFNQALLFAGLFAWALTPLVNKYKKYISNERRLIAILVFALLAVFIIPLTIVIFKGISNIGQIQQSGLAELPLYKNIEHSINTVWDFLNRYALKFDFNLEEQFDVKSILPKVAQVVIPVFTAIITNLPGFLMQLLIFIACLYYFLIKRREILTWVRDFGLMPDQSLNHLVDFLQRVCYTTVISTIVVASVQALIVSVAGVFAGYKDFLIIFLVTFFMSFVPVLGSGPISIALALYSFMQGEIGAGIILSIAAAFAGVIDNVIRTYLLSGEEESVHPLISLLALIGGVIVFGVSGLFLGPIVSQLAFSIHKIMGARKPSEIQIENSPN